jgi:hypothetical protein
MDETWTSGRDMAISRTKVGERSSVIPGDYASIRVNISKKPWTSMDETSYLPNEQVF